MGKHKGRGVSARHKTHRGRVTPRKFVGHFAWTMVLGDGDDCPICRALGIPHSESPGDQNLPENGEGPGLAARPFSEPFRSAHGGSRREDQPR